MLVIVFRSGAVLELDADEAAAEQMIGFFYRSVNDPDAVIGVDLLEKASSICRVRAGDVSGMFVQP